MKYCRAVDNRVSETGILRESAAVAVDCIVDCARCPRVQTLAHIAKDYLEKMEGVWGAVESP